MSQNLSRGSGTLGYASRCIARFEVRNFYNPDWRSAVFVVPGLIGTSACRNNQDTG
jgi:hypothetical protein